MDRENGRKTKRKTRKISYSHCQLSLKILPIFWRENFGRPFLPHSFFPLPIYQPNHGKQENQIFPSFLLTSGKSSSENIVYSNESF